MSRIVTVAILIDLPDEQVSDGVSEWLGNAPEYVIDWGYTEPGEFSEDPGVPFDYDPALYAEGDMFG